MEIEGMSLRDYVSAKYMEYKDLEQLATEQEDTYLSKFFYGMASAMYDLRNVLDGSVSPCKPISD